MPTPVQPLQQRLNELLRIKAGGGQLPTGPSIYTQEEEDELEKLKLAMMQGAGFSSGAKDADLYGELAFLRRLLSLGSEETLSGHMTPGRTQYPVNQWDQIGDTLGTLSERKRAYQELLK